MSSASKTTTKAELVAIYRLEFYRKQNNWKLCQDVRKEKEQKEKDANPTKLAKKKSVAELQKSAKKQLDETYIVEKPASGLDKAFLESEPDTNLAKATTQSKNEPAEPKNEPKEPKDQPKEPKEEPKGWFNSKRKLALTALLQSEAFNHPSITDEEVQDLTWPEAGDEPCKNDVEDVQPQPVCPKEDQIWPQSLKSCPEPVLWRDNELTWPAAGQQAQKVADTKLPWLAATHQGQNSVDAQLLWPADSQQAQKVTDAKLPWLAATRQGQNSVDAELLWPADSQQAQKVTDAKLPWLAATHQGQNSVDAELQWPADCQQNEAMKSPWGDDLQQGKKDIRPEVDLRALSPEALFSTAEEWHHEPLAGDSSDECGASACCGLRAFMLGAHRRPHSSELDLANTRQQEWLSQSDLCACMSRHANPLHALLCEPRVRHQLSAELESHRSAYERSIYEQFPIRDVGLQGPPPTLQELPTLQGPAQTFQGSPTLQGPTPTIQGLPPTMQGRPQTFQGPPLTLRGSLPNSHGSPTLQGPPPTMQGRPQIFQGSLPNSQELPTLQGLQGPPPTLQELPTLQGPAQTFQGSPTLQGPTPTIQGLPPTMQGRPQTFQGPPLTLRGSLPNSHGSPTLQGPPPTMQGRPQIFQGSLPNSQELPTLQGPAPTLQGSPTLQGPAPNFQGATNLQEPPPTFQGSPAFQGPPPSPTFQGLPKPGPEKPGNFISGSFLNNPYFDLENSISTPAPNNLLSLLLK